MTVVLLYDINMRVYGKNKYIFIYVNKQNKQNLYSIKFDLYIFRGALWKRIVLFRITSIINNSQVYLTNPLYLSKKKKKSALLKQKENKDDLFILIY